MNHIYTFGYGKTKKHNFLERLTAIQQELQKKLVLVDIRRSGCGSRNGAWCHHPGMERNTGLAGTIQDETPHGYIAMPRLANEYGTSQRALRKYQANLIDAISSGTGYIYLSIDRLCQTIEERPERAFILLCSEHYAFRRMKGDQFDRVYENLDNLTTRAVTCHRVFVARELLTYMEKFSYVCHL